VADETRVGFIVAEGEDPFALMRRLLGTPYAAQPGAPDQFEGVCVGARLHRTADGRNLILATYRGERVPAAGAPRFGGFREAAPYYRPGGPG
jgi:hypothetical protein